jgi:hypothetical protein
VDVVVVGVVVDVTGRVVGVDGCVVVTGNVVAVDAGWDVDVVG